MRGLLTVLFLLPALAHAADPVAVVSRYLPPQAQHIISRTDGERVVAGLGSSLAAGDRIAVESGGSLTIAYADGSEDTLEGPQDFTLPEKQALGAAGRILGRLQTLLSRQYRQGSNLATRGSDDCKDAAAAELRVPALQSKNFLLEGHDNLTLAWIGGCAPYRLTFTGLDGGPVVLADLPRAVARLSVAGLPAGEYQLQITDSRGIARQFDLAVSAGMPAGPLGNEQPANELEAVAQAAWLANLDGGTWRWESFQQLRPWIRRGGTLAGTYGDLIMWGDLTAENVSAATD